MQKLNKNKKKIMVQQESDDEDRDDFEGFGSITAMAQNKEKLVSRTLNDPKFQAQLKAEQDAKDAKAKLITDAANAKKTAEMK